MLVIYGGQDIFVTPQATRRSIKRARALGDTIDVIFHPDRGHRDVDTSAYVRWLGESFSELRA